jgi:predicted  nucleic acid-binding Zn-ribbon protein
MKITKHDLIALINEVLEEDVDKFDRAIDTLRKKQQALNVASRKIGVDIAKQQLGKAQDKEQTASDALDAAEARGEDFSKEDESLQTAKQATEKARDGLSAANNSLKAAQQGGAPT